MIYENSFGIPEMLPAGYGGNRSQPASLRSNTDTSQGAPVAVRNPTPPTPQPTATRANPPGAYGRPMNYGQSPGIHEMRNVPPVLKLSNLENEFDDPYEHIYELGGNSEYEIAYGYSYQNGYGGFGAADVGPAIQVDAATKLKYRDYDDGAGYVYRQFSNGSYAIIKGAVPSGIKLGKAFTSKENSAAFTAIKGQVEGAIGVFPAGVKPTTADSKKLKRKKAGAKGAGKKPVVKKGFDPNAALAVAGKIATKFQASGIAAPPITPTSMEAELPVDETTTGEAWYSKKYFGAPGWLWAIGGAVVVVGGGYAAVKMTAAKPAVAPAPQGARKAAKAVPAIETAPAPVMEGSAPEEQE